VNGREIGITEVTFDERVERMVVSVLRSGKIAQGPMVESMERAVASAAGVRHAVAVSNGTASLVAALHVLGVGKGDEVITSPFTFVATINAILAVGARPVC
jgi:dTDP-4-amino-4,6-dideoxygalactose transaminase